MKPWHLVVLLVVILLLFGAPRLPELARSIGKSARILKEETQQLVDSDKKPTEDNTDEARGS